MRRLVILAASALLAGLLCRPAAGAPTSQPAQAPDKALHFLLGASCALLVSAVAAPALAELPQPDLRYALQVSAAGLGAACFAGIVKELADIAGFGDPEWLDLLATVGGGLVASAVVFAAGASNPTRRGWLPSTRVSGRRWRSRRRRTCSGAFLPGEVALQRSEVVLLPALLVLGALPRGDVRMPQRDPRAASGLLQQHLQA